ELLLDRRAVEHAQHEIEDDQIGRPVLNEMQRVDAVARIFDLVARHRERRSEQPAQVGVVFDDQDPFLTHPPSWMISGIPYPWKAEPLSQLSNPAVAVSTDAPSVKHCPHGETSPAAQSRIHACAVLPL